MSSFRATRASRAKTSSLLLPLIPDHETSELAVGYDAQKAKQMSSPEASKGTSYSSEEGFKESIGAYDIARAYSSYLLFPSLIFKAFARSRSPPHRPGDF